MNRQRLSGVLLGLLIAAAPAPAQGLVGTPPPGGVGTIGGGFGGGLGGGLGGIGGGLGGMCGLGGCCGMMGIGGGIAGIGGMHGFGCWGTGMSLQFYSDWTHFPGRSYYHRSFHFPTAIVLGSNPATVQELRVIHYPDRPHYFYYYDPQQKKYVGRYRPDASDNDCFALLSPKARKRSLAEIPEQAYGRWGPMPTLAALSGASTAFSPQLQRPPAGLPGHDLPPDEPLDK